MDRLFDFLEVVAPIISHAACFFAGAVFGWWVVGPWIFG